MKRASVFSELDPGLIADESRYRRRAGLSSRPGPPARDSALAALG